MAWADGYLLLLLLLLAFGAGVSVDAVGKGSERRLGALAQADALISAPALDMRDHSRGTVEGNPDPLMALH